MVKAGCGDRRGILTRSMIKARVAPESPFMPVLNGHIHWETMHALPAGQVALHLLTH